MAVLTRKLILLIGIFGAFPAHATTNRSCSDDLPLHSRLLMLISDKPSTCSDPVGEFRKVDTDYWKASIGDREFREGLKKPQATGGHSFVNKRQEMTFKAEAENDIGVKSLKG